MVYLPSELAGFGASSQAGCSAHGLGSSEFWTHGTTLQKQPLLCCCALHVGLRTSEGPEARMSEEAREKTPARTASAHRKKKGKKVTGDPLRSFRDPLRSLLCLLEVALIDKDKCS